MPKATVIQTNFTAGELSPRLHGRIDIAKYQNAAKRMRDVVPVQHGGVVRREGGKYVAEVKDSSSVTRLIPFIYSTSDAYVLEVGVNYIRFYKDGAQILSGGSPYEIAFPQTAYDSSIIFEMDYTQGEDTMLFFHESFWPRRLRRFADSHWVLDSMPVANQPYIDRGETRGIALTFGATSGTGITVTNAPHWYAADVGREILYLGGAATIVAVVSPTQITVNITVPFSTTSIPASLWTLTGTPVSELTPSAAGPVGATITLTLTTPGWHTNMTAFYRVRINGGICKINSLSGANNEIANCTVIRELTGTTAAPYDSWSMEGEAFHLVGSYPCTGTIHEQRLNLGGSPLYPQTIFGSKIGEYYDFTTGVNDDDGYSFKIASDQANPILYLASGRALMVFTYGGEFTVEGGVEKPITPTNLQVRLRTNRGCARVRPVRVDFEEMYVQRSGGRIFAFGYNASAGDWASSDIALLSEHLVSGGATELAYQQDPDPRIYAKRADGKLAVCSFSREQDINGWTLWDLGGAVKSIAVTPTETAERVTVIVEREIDGDTVQYVEVLAPGVFFDCAITGSSGPGATTWAGLGHLEGETVGAVADGYYAGEFTVTGGEIVLPEPANSVTIGLRYIPTIEPMTPDLGAGYAQGNSVRVGEVSLRFLETTNCQVNGDEISFRQIGATLLDQPLDPFTGLKRVETLGWNRGDAEMVITARWPFSFHLLSLIRKITVND